jgi:hypothetical protein
MMAAKMTTCNLLACMALAFAVATGLSMPPGNAGSLFLVMQNCVKAGTIGEGRASSIYAWFRPSSRIKVITVKKLLKIAWMSSGF